MRDILPQSVNVQELITILTIGPVEDVLNGFVIGKQVSEATAWMAVENNYHTAIPYILKNPTFIEFFLPLLGEEKLASLASSKEQLIDHMVKNLNLPAFQTVIGSLVRGSQNKKVTAEILASLQRHKKREMIMSIIGFGTPAPSFFNKGKTATPQFVTLISSTSMPLNTYHRRKHYESVRAGIPEKMNEATAEQLLTYLENLCHRSQYSTFTQLPDILGAVNHCLRTLMSVRNIKTGVEFWKANKGKFKHLFGWITGVDAVLKTVYNPR